MINVVILLIGVLASTACISTGRPLVRPDPLTHRYDLAYENPEFPPHDQGVWRVQRRGRVAKAAAAALAHAPTAADTPALLAEANRLDDALRTLEQIVDRYPGRIGQTFESLSPHLNVFANDRLHPDRVERLRKIGLAARQKAAALPTENAARATFQLDFLEFFFTGKGRVERASQLQRFAKEYAGTQQALIAEVDAISQQTNLLEEIASLRRFAADHPGTAAAAKALYQAGFQLGVNVALTGLVPRGGDPTERLFEVHELMNELQSGRYPHSEWVERAPSLVLGLFASGPTYAPGNINRLLRLYQTIVNQQLTHADEVDIDVALRALGKMARLTKLKGDTSEMDNVFIDMAKRGNEALVHYLKARVYIELMNDEWRDDRTTLLKKVKDALTSAQKNRDGIYARRSLAILASLHFAQGDFANAHDAYRGYLRAYPESPWSWVAALRFAESIERLGDARSAAEAFRKTASAYGHNPFARTFGHAYAARALESLQQFDDALVDTQQALEAWDDDFGPAYSISMGYPGMPSELRKDDLQKEQLALRLGQMRESAGKTDGNLLERARWLLGQDRPTDALVPLEQVLRSSGAAAVAPDARLLIHEARIQRALELATATPRPDVAAAISELDLVASDEYDIGVLTAKVAKATLLWRQGSTGGSDATAVSTRATTLMQDALSEWRTHQMPSTVDPQTPIHRDVAEIRRLVFQPPNDGIYSGWARGRHRWKQPPRPFLVVNPEVRVKFADGIERVVSSYDEPGDKEQVLFLTSAQISLLREIPIKLEPDPSPRTSHVLELWTQFVAAERRFFGGGVTIATHSILRDVEYLDAQRTRAAARVVVGAEGCTLVLEKDGGVWKIVRLTDMWIA